MIKLLLHWIVYCVDYVVTLLKHFFVWFSITYKKCIKLCRFGIVGNGTIWYMVKVITFGNYIGLKCTGNRIKVNCTFCNFPLWNFTVVLGTVMLKWLYVAA